MAIYITILYWWSYKIGDTSLKKIGTEHNIKEQWYNKSKWYDTSQDQSFNKCIMNDKLVGKGVSMSCGSPCMHG